LWRRNVLFCTLSNRFNALSIVDESYSTFGIVLFLTIKHFFVLFTCSMFVGAKLVAENVGSFFFVMMQPKPSIQFVCCIVYYYLTTILICNIYNNNERKMKNGNSRNNEFELMEGKLNGVVMEARKSGMEMASIKNGREDGKW
jgi:hypothetical protein